MVHVVSLKQTTQIVSIIFLAARNSYASTDNTNIAENVTELFHFRKTRQAFTHMLHLQQWCFQFTPFKRLKLYVNQLISSHQLVHEAFETKWYTELRKTVMDASRRKRSKGKKEKKKRSQPLENVLKVLDLQVIWVNRCAEN